MQKGLKKYFWLFALPTLIAFAIAFLVPFVMGIYLSFTKFTTVTNATFVGLDNYVALFKDRLFVQAFGNTILFVIKQGNLIHPLTIEARNFLIIGTSVTLLSLVFGTLFKKYKIYLYI